LLKTDATTTSELIRSDGNGILTNVAMYRCLLEAPAADPRVAKRIRANLDRDGGVEQVEIVAGSRRNPYGGTVRIPIRYVRVVDRVQGRLLKRRI